MQYILASYPILTIYAEPEEAVAAYDNFDDETWGEPGTNLNGQNRWESAIVGSGVTKSKFEIVKDPQRDGNCVMYKGQGTRAKAVRTFLPQIDVIYIEIDIMMTDLESPLSFYVLAKSGVLATVYFANGSIKYHNGSGYSDFTTPSKYKPGEWSKIMLVIHANESPTTADYYVNGVMVEQRGVVRNPKLDLVYQVELYGGENETPYYFDNFKIYQKYEMNRDKYEKWVDVPPFDFSTMSPEDLQDEDYFLKYRYILNKPEDYAKTHLPYYLAHFHEVANSVVEYGPVSWIYFTAN